MEKWLLWRDKSWSPYMNMAVDELLLEQSAKLGTPLIRIYGWDRPSVSIGYIQDYSAAPEEDYAVVRRPTGGGIVFHDVDLTYTAVVPVDHHITSLDRMESYHVFHRAILKALEKFGIAGALAPNESGPVDRATMQCFVTPTRYDVVSDGKKYAGAAQRRTKNGILHQGSIMREASGGDLDRLAKVLIHALKTGFNIEFENYTPSEEFIKRAEELADSKYAMESWNVTRTWKK